MFRLGLHGCPIGTSTYSLSADDPGDRDIYGYQYNLAGVHATNALADHDLLLLRSGYAYVHYSSLESVFEASKEGYYLGLRRTQGTMRSETPAWEPWIIYFLQSLRQQKSRLEAKIKRERLMTQRLPELSVQILELAKAHGRITNSQIVGMAGANRNTVKKHLQMLVSDNHLVQRGSGKATYYSRV